MTRRGGKWSRISMTRHHQAKRSHVRRKVVTVTLSDIPRAEYIDHYGNHTGSRAMCPAEEQTNCWCG